MFPVTVNKRYILSEFLIIIQFSGSQPFMARGPLPLNKKNVDFVLMYLRSIIYSPRWTSKQKTQIQAKSKSKDC